MFYPALRRASHPEDAGPRDSARAAGLRYVSDATPGIRRQRAGRRFTFIDGEGSRIGDADTLRRIRALAIPPAWADVWICPIAHGHLQATGRDARGRKQYRYHPRWRLERDKAKYARMLDFARALPAIRARVAADLARPGLSREKVIAAVVRLLETTRIRVGNDEYARMNKSFGLTTLRARHVTISGAMLCFRFVGKGARRHAVAVRDGQLARIVRRCQELPGADLFQYVDEHGGHQIVGSADVNAYLREIAGDDVTAKDFRTWAGTVLAARALREVPAFDSERQAKRNILRAIEGVAAQLGNTSVICRKSYVHPDILDAYLDKASGHARWRRAERRGSPSNVGLRPEEAAVVALIERRRRRADRADAA